MNCPHCGHKVGCIHFMLTVINPWKIRCAKCSEVYSIGKTGNRILLFGVIIAAAIGVAMAMLELPIWVMAVGAGIFGAAIEAAIWAKDTAVKIKH